MIDTLLRLVKALKREGVDFVVAPYEADAQMALLCRLGLADFVISEDSDCIPFGCPRVSMLICLSHWPACVPLPPHA